LTEYGYTGEILKIDLSNRSVSKLATAQYADRFLGGRGIAAKIYWDFVSPLTKAFDPENCLIFITGPVAGFTRFAGSRWQICGKSPQMRPETFSFANLGGNWGVWLKYAGYDGLIVTGKAERPVYLYIEDDDKVEFRDASHLWGKTNMET
jgi:aldehyde:ferredoxin oxidoreductase